MGKFIIPALFFAYPPVWVATFIRVVALSYPDPEVKTTRGRDTFIIVLVAWAFLVLAVSLQGFLGMSASATYAMAYLVLSYWSMLCAWRAAGRHESRSLPVAALLIGSLPVWACLAALSNMAARAG